MNETIKTFIRVLDEDNIKPRGRRQAMGKLEINEE
jgi:hypothetical protein